jgi:hypothetical protein
MRPNEKYDFFMPLAPLLSLVGSKPHQRQGTVTHNILILGLIPINKVLKIIL